MCTVAVAIGADRRWPLVVAANRDERLDRPAEGWALRPLPSGGRIAAPRDAEAGGTWIGVAATGLTVAITNFHAPGGGPPDRTRRSRGELVTGALAQGTLARARAWAAAQEARAFNPFHLLVLEGAAGFLWRFDGERAALEPLGPGLHVVTEREADGRGPRGELVRSRWPLDLSPPRLRDLLALHGEPPADFPCLHLGDVYGTRSSTILRLAPDLGASELYAADAAPCAAPFEDRSRLLAELARGG